MSVESAKPACLDCLVLGGQIYVEYANGTLANQATGVYNHHVILDKVGQPNRVMVCPGQKSNAKPMMPTALFLGGANDDSKQLFTSTDGQFKAGFHILGTDSGQLTAELMNYRAERQEVFIVVETEYVEGKPEGYLSTHTLTMSVSDCETNEWKLSEKVTKQTSGEWIVPADGYIINTQGHLHDGGAGVDLEVNGKNVCTSTAVYEKLAAGSKGHGGMRRRDGPGSNHESGTGEVLTRMTKCTDLVPIKKGDKIRTIARFDLVAHPT